MVVVARIHSRPLILNMHIHRLALESLGGESLRRHSHRVRHSQTLSLLQTSKHLDVNVMTPEHHPQNLSTLSSPIFSLKILLSTTFPPLHPPCLPPEATISPPTRQRASASTPPAPSSLHVCPPLNLQTQLTRPSGHRPLHPSLLRLPPLPLPARRLCPQKDQHLHGLALHHGRRPRPPLRCYPRPRKLS